MSGKQFVCMAFTDVCSIRRISHPTHCTRFFFDSSNGNAVLDNIVGDGDAIDAHINPIREGYVFGGWYDTAVCIHLKSISRILS